MLIWLNFPILRHYFQFALCIQHFDHICSNRPYLWNNVTQYSPADLPQTAGPAFPTTPCSWSPLFLYSPQSPSSHFYQPPFWDFLSDPGIPGVRSMGPSVCNWGRLLKLQVIQVIDSIQVLQVIDSIQVIQLINSIQLIDSIQVIDSIQRRWPFLVAPSGGQICN